MTALPRIGLVGVGSMGWPMGARIAGGGYALTVLDANAAHAGAFARDHEASVAATAADLAAASDIVITILPSSAIVESVMTGADGLLSRLSPGTVVLEMSSGVPGITRRLAGMVAERGGVLVDAPVSGGVPRARTGELAIMVGGDAGAIARAEPVLKLMGTSITPTGGVGTAHAMKALNNLVSAGGFLIGIEAMLIGRKFGLDPEVMVDVLNSSTGMNNSTQKKFRQFVLSRRFDAGFGLDLMVKDLSIAVELAKETSAATPFAACCREMWAASAVALGPGQDHTAMARWSESIAGVTLSEDE